MTTLLDDIAGPRKQGTTTLIDPLAGGGTTVAQPDLGQAEAVEPVVGWLVVVSGPGQGRSIQLSYGNSTVGRGLRNRVVIDFGDDKISEEDNFRISYDGENRAFFLIPGTGKNLVYVKGQPHHLMSPLPLESGAEMRVGSTTLRFVAFCSSEWDWAMLSQPG